MADGEKMNGDARTTEPNGTNGTEPTPKLDAAEVVINPVTQNGTVGIPVEFTVDLTRAINETLDGNDHRPAILINNGEVIPDSCSCIAQGLYQVRFTPWEEKLHRIEISVNNEMLPQSPIYVSVMEGAEIVSYPPSTNALSFSAAYMPNDRPLAEINQPQPQQPHLQQQQSQSHHEAEKQSTEKLTELTQAKDKAQLTACTAMSIINVGLLREVLRQGPDNNRFYTAVLVLIILSLIFQVLVGVLSLMIGHIRTYYTRYRDNMCENLFSRLCFCCPRNKDDVEVTGNLIMPSVPWASGNIYQQRRGTVPSLADQPDYGMASASKRATLDKQDDHTNDQDDQDVTRVYIPYRVSEDPVLPEADSEADSGAPEQQNRNPDRSYNEEIPLVERTHHVQSSPKVHFSRGSSGYASMEAPRDPWSMSRRCQDPQSKMQDVPDGNIKRKPPPNPKKQLVEHLVEWSGKILEAEECYVEAGVRIKHLDQQITSTGKKLTAVQEQLEKVFHEEKVLSEDVRKATQSARGLTRKLDEITILEERTRKMETLRPNIAPAPRDNSDGPIVRTQVVSLQSELPKENVFKIGLEKDLKAAIELRQSLKNASLQSGQKRRKLEEELFMMMDKLETAERNKEEEEEKRRNYENMKERGKLLRRKADNIQRRRVLKTISFWQQIINYILYFVFVLNAFITGLGFVSPEEGQN